MVRAVLCAVSCAEKAVRIICPGSPVLLVRFSPLLRSVYRVAHPSSLVAHRNGPVEGTISSAGHWTCHTPRTPCRGTTQISPLVPCLL